MTGEGIGICYTRTGRRFFDNATLEAEFLDRICTAATAAGFWDEFKTDWLCLDCELMPWSAKAQELVKQQYAAVGTSARASLVTEVAVLEQTVARGLNVSELLAHTTERRRMVNDYVEAYRRYCWPVNSVNDLKLAPFHLRHFQPNDRNLLHFHPGTGQQAGQIKNRHIQIHKIF